MNNDKYKHPKTFHFEFSLSVQSDDKIHKDLSNFTGKRIIVSEKMDGECTSMYPNYYHARSIDSAHNFTRDWCKKLQSYLSKDIPEGWRFVGENVAYYHSINYQDLISYFYLFNIWNEKNFCLSHDETIEFANILDLATPAVFYDGIFDIDALKEIAKNLDTNKHEGFVVRIADSFHHSEYSKSTGKFVRAGHVQSGEHWLKNTYPNRLTSDKTLLKPQIMFL